MRRLTVLLVLLLAACAHRPVDDLTLSTKVKIELLADPQLGALRLDASTLNGVVTLSGTVPSQAEADRAVAAAKRVAGVRSVKSELKVGSRQSAVTSLVGSLAVCSPGLQLESSQEFAVLQFAAGKLTA